eukprot:TRINITY_DN3707_c0_g2_i1.p1 TRINITY_DN3707_c0_g2~~TRINITY_DN3707_c0_g2_i1.p1  ORF type:complete len:368 (+),score=84.57 TRINITY_DN3707_c0_g2_i1:153-1256(+)
MEPEVENEYKGPELKGLVTLEFVEALKDWQKEKKLLRKDVIEQLCKETRIAAGEIVLCMGKFTIEYRYCKFRTIAQRAKKFTVVGDLHGQYDDLLHIFDINGVPSKTNPYLFNGDFIDRGENSIETVLLLFAYKALYPDSVHLIRGNHEFEHMSQEYTFESEIKSKYGEEHCASILNTFVGIFQALPLAVVLDEKVFICHGGLPSAVAKLLNIKKNRGVQDSTTEDFFWSLLWNDPVEAGLEKVKYLRETFGPDVTNQFFTENKLELMIRSHQYQWSGTKRNHDGKVITVFSASNYCKSDNYGAILIFDEELNYTIKRYTVPKAHNKVQIAMVHDILDNIINTSIGIETDGDESNKDGDEEVIQADC